MCGELYAVDIGIPVESTTTVLSAMDVRRVLPHRKPDSHKGTYGHAAVIAGSTGKSGAAYLAGKGALRSGAGLSTIISPARVQQTVASLGPEVMTHIASGHPDYFNVDAANDVVSACADKNAVAIGPGIGTHEETRTFLQILIPQIKSGLVIDADGLNLLARDRSVLGKRLPRSTVLTPHPGEMARLLGMDTAAVQNDRIGSAARLASETQSIVILKGYRTILADPQGTIRICPTGSYPLASAGTGDVLTGAIVGFIAQGLTPMDAAQAGVYIHGFTANLFEREFPQQALNAGDILNDWNRAVHLVRTAKDLEGEYLGIHLLL
jgi:NAD(P)H-hydrate epimerase